MKNTLKSNAKTKRTMPVMKTGVRAGGGSGDADLTNTPTGGTGDADLANSYSGPEVL